jgi:hypothetical protein
MAQLCLVLDMILACVSAEATDQLYTVQPNNYSDHSCTHRLICCPSCCTAAASAAWALDSPLEGVAAAAAAASPFAAAALAAGPSRPSPSSESSSSTTYMGTAVSTHNSKQVAVETRVSAKSDTNCVERPPMHQQTSRCCSETPLQRLIHSNLRGSCSFQPACGEAHQCRCRMSLMHVQHNMD